MLKNATAVEMQKNPTNQRFFLKCLLIIDCFFGKSCLPTYTHVSRFPCFICQISFKFPNRKEKTSLVAILICLTLLVLASFLCRCPALYQRFKTLFRNCPAVSDYRNSLSWKQFKKHFDPRFLLLSSS